MKAASCIPRLLNFGRRFMFIFFGLSICLFPAVCPAQMAVYPGSLQSTEALPSPAQVDDFLQLAERNNPGLKAAFHRWQSAALKVPQATSLEDPRLSYMEYLDKTMETEREIGLMQMFPYPGKRRLKGTIESTEAEALHKEMEKARLELRSQVKDAFYELYYLEQTIRTTRENLDLMRHFESVATARFGVGRGGNRDVVKAQVELGKMENELRSLEDSRKPIHARLNALLNRPPESSLPPLTEITLESFEPNIDDLRRQASFSNPELQALDMRIQKSQTMLSLAHQAKYPDFSIGLNWMDANERMMENARDEWIASFEMNLPVYRKRIEAGVREAESGVRELLSMRQELHNRISADLEDQLYKYRNAQRQLRLLSDVLVPKARQALEVTESAYRTDQASFLELIDSERELLVFQESYYRSVADSLQALARSESLTGRPTAALPRAAGPAGLQEAPLEEEPATNTAPVSPSPEEPPAPSHNPE